MIAFPRFAHDFSQNEEQEKYEKFKCQSFCIWEHFAKDALLNTVWFWALRLGLLKTCLVWLVKWRLIYRLIAIVWHVIWFSWLILQKIHRMVFTVFAGNRANQQALYNCLTHNRPYVLNSVSLRYLFFYQFVPFVPPLSSEEVSFSISLSCHPKWKCHMCVINQIDSICFVLISVFVNANIHQQPGPPTSTISKTWEYFHAVPEQEI